MGMIQIKGVVRLIILRQKAHVCQNVIKVSRLGNCSVVSEESFPWLVGGVGQGEISEAPIVQDIAEEV